MDRHDPAFRGAAAVTCGVSYDLGKRKRRAHLQAQSLDPDALALHYALYRRIMFGDSPLSRTEREMIAVVVSRTNSCEYLNRSPQRFTALRFA